MRSGIGSSLSRGHARSSPDAAVSTFHSLSKFPLLPCGAIAFVAGVALGMSGPAPAANLAVSYSSTGELADPRRRRAARSSRPDGPGRRRSSSR